MEAITLSSADFTVDDLDLKALYIAAGGYKVLGDYETTYKEDSKVGYVSYYNRNKADLAKYGEPKTYSQWINSQTIYLTSNVF